MLAQEVEESIRASGAAEIDAHEVGLAILDPLQKLDQVAYLRFASVYQAFESLEDFESAIALLRHEAETKRTAGRARSGQESGRQTPVWPRRGSRGHSPAPTPVAAAERGSPGRHRLPNRLLLRTVRDI